MIFVTVGAQMPFDRLIGAVDEWATLRGRQDVLAQIGPSNFKPRTIRVARFLAPEEFRTRIDEADLVVAHAGMGSIISALEMGKPIIVMARRGSLMETRNDHQVATAEFFEKAHRVIAAADEYDLLAKLDDADHYKASERIGSHASPVLIRALHDFITADIPRA